MNVTITLSCDAVHGALVIVHLKVYTPIIDTVTLDVGELALLKVAVPGPETKVQVPVPVVGVFPASAKVSPHPEKSTPALATVGGAFTTMDT